MSKTLTPLIGTIVAVGLFFSYIQPTFEDIRGIQDEAAQYAQAVEKASELQQRINELKQRQSSISLADLERLEALLPGRVDEVAVLIDLDAIASSHNLTLGDVEVGDREKNEADGQNAQNQPSIVAAPNQMIGSSDDEAPTGLEPSETVTSQYATLDISFSVVGTYNDFRMFLRDIERSLVLMEVTKITFTESEGDAVPFAVTVRLYSLNPPTS